jgi:hypothetical protein
MSDYAKNIKRLFLAVILASLCGCNGNNYYTGTQSYNSYPARDSKPNFVRLGTLENKQNNLTNPTQKNYIFNKPNNDKGGKFIGNLNSNPYDPNSISNPYGKYGSRYSPDSVNNPYGKYGSKFSHKSARNPFATDAPKLYDSNGKYMGKLSTNKYDPDSISNPYGRFGNQYSPDSVNNKFGAGNPFSPSSPTSPYGSGFKIKTNSTSRQPFFGNTNNNSFTPRQNNFYGNY